MALDISISLSEEDYQRAQFLARIKNQNLSEIIAELVSVQLNEAFAKEKQITKKSPINKDPFFGIWEDREEMNDSSEYVKSLRQTQWKNKSE